MADDQRRNFLKMAGSIGIAGALPAAAAATPQFFGQSLKSLDTGNWDPVRKLFQFSQKAPLNAANLCPAFSYVLNSQIGYYSSLCQDASLLTRRTFILDHVEPARRKCADMLGIGSSNRLAFVRNTTEANATVINGLHLGSDDEVLLWDQNHGSNYQAWEYRRSHYPFGCKSLTLATTVKSKQVILDAFMSQINAKTRVVSFSHVSNISGIRIPAAELVKAIHNHNPEIFVHIDGAQSWGSMAVNLAEIGCDSYSASGHKWLCGPRGTGVLALREKSIEKLTPTVYGYDFQYNYPEDELQPNAFRFENLGQRDTAAYGALGETIDLQMVIGIQRTEQRIRELTQYTLNAFDQAGIVTVTPKSPELSHGVIAADLGNKWKAYGAFLALHNAGYASAFVHGNRICCEPGRRPHESDLPVYLRICPHIYNSHDDIDQAVAIAKRIKESDFEIVKEVVRYL